MRPHYIAAALVMLLFLPGVKAIDPPIVTFIPSQISANSGFVLISDPNSVQTEMPVTVTWLAPGIESNYTLFNGFVQNAYNKWIYYFSNTDAKANGPNIFSQSTASYGVPYTLIIDAINKYGQKETTELNLTIGGIDIRTDYYVSGKTVTLWAWPYQNSVSSMLYEVYNDAFDKIKSGSMSYKIDSGKFFVNITLDIGEYYIAFKGNSSIDFGGGIAHVAIGGTGPGTTGVYVEPIVYRPVVSAGSPFTLKRFKITNTGTQNLTGLSITVPQEILSACNCQLSIEPESTSLAPNQSTLMTVSLRNIQSSMNISIFATLLSGSNELYQIPVNLDVSVLAGSCSGKPDGTDCLGGICCSNQCQKKANCCSNSDCASGTCSPTTYQCTTPTDTNECNARIDMDTCTGGICCSGVCRSGGTCCSESDCSAGYTCSISNTCESTNQSGCKSSLDCPGSEVCKDGQCVTPPSGCTSDNDCADGKTCQTDGTCAAPGMDLTTIAIIGGGVAAAAVVGFIVFKKFVKKKGSGDEEELGGEDKEGEEEFSDEDFY